FPCGSPIIMPIAWRPEKTEKYPVSLSIELHREDMRNEAMMTRVQANMLLLLAGVIWGMGFVAQSTAMASIGPFLFIGIRSAIAALTILPWAIAEGRRTKASLVAGNYLYFML